jgi:hypothetical protein
LTHDLKPFYGGTYWPPTSRMGMPGFDQVLTAVADAWQNRRDQAIEQADSLTENLDEAARARTEPGDLDPALVAHAVVQLERSFDRTYGGFGGAPKFPHPMDLRLLAHAWHRKPSDDLLRMVTFTLDRMAAGGMYDQLGGGFHRYSVDERWLVPHFEKMLYDNALLVPCYLDAFQMTGDADYARVAREICDYVLREMTDAQGGFYSTQDADSEGEEGKFFVWTPAEVDAILGSAAAETFNYVYDITPEGNFEHGHNILNRPKTLAQCASVLGRQVDELQRELASDRARLLLAREKRVHPPLDDKVLVAWNGLMIEALALAAGALDEPRYLAAAQNAAKFVLSQMRRPDGRLLHSWRRGAAKLDAYLDDYACLANALVTLYEADFDEHWIDEAIALADWLLRLFADADGGGFFFTASDHEQLITRQKDLFDNAVPSGNSMAAMVLLRLGKLTGRPDYLSAAEATLRGAAALMHQAPRATGQMLLALDMFLGPTPEIIVIGDSQAPETAKALADLRHRYIPNKLLACRRADQPAGSSALSALFANKEAKGAQPAVFICERFACQAPLFGKSATIAAWKLLEGQSAKNR